MDLLQKLRIAASKVFAHRSRAMSALVSRRSWSRSGLPPAGSDASLATGAAGETALLPCAAVCCRGHRELTRSVCRGDAKPHRRRQRGSAGSTAAELCCRSSHRGGAIRLNGRLRAHPTAREERPANDEQDHDGNGESSESSPRAWRARLQQKEMPAPLATPLPPAALQERLFVRHRSRSRSATTSRTISPSIGFRFNAHPNDNELKQRLLILRGMPSLYCDNQRQRLPW